MPYKIKGKCIYDKDTGKRIGCTKGSVQRYLKVLQINVKEQNCCKEMKLSKILKEIKK